MKLVYLYSTIQASLKSDNNNGYLTWRPIYIVYRIPLSKKCFRQSCSENQYTHLLFNNFSRKPWRLWDKMEKYCRARQATNDNIIRRMLLVSWVPKATDTRSKYVILIAFHCNNGYANAPQCDITPTLPDLILLMLSVKTGVFQTFCSRSSFGFRK